MQINPKQGFMIAVVIALQAIIKLDHILYLFVLPFLRLDTDQPVPKDSDQQQREVQGSVLCRQESVYRVNCMDCLDRTNVTQSVFAREVLQSAVSTSLQYIHRYIS